MWPGPFSTAAVKVKRAGGHSNGDGKLLSRLSFTKDSDDEQSSLALSAREVIKDRGGLYIAMVAIKVEGGHSNGNVYLHLPPTSSGSLAHS